MKDDLWVAQYSAEYVSSNLLKGQYPVEVIDSINERLEDIELLFIKRFGKLRGRKLIRVLKDQGDCP